MIFVAYTSPINYLILIGAIDVLSALYQKIVVPTAVYGELQSDATPAEVRAWTAKTPDWFTVLPITILLDDALPNLDEGEKQAIALFEEIKADALIIDERQGRARCRPTRDFCHRNSGRFKQRGTERFVEYA